MGRKLLIVASKRYGDYVKEIAESMGCFEEISFVIMTEKELLENWRTWKVFIRNITVQ